MAWLVYIDDHNDGLVPNKWDLGNWGSPPGSWVVGDAQIDIGPTNLSRGVLFGYVNSAALHRCPADKSTAPQTIWGGPFYSFNPYVFGWTGSWDSVPAGRHLRGATLTFADGHVEYWRWRWPKQTQTDGTQPVNKDDRADWVRLLSGNTQP